MLTMGKAGRSQWLPVPVPVPVPVPAGAGTHERPARFGKASVNFFLL